MHGVGVLAPLRELVCVESEFLLKGVDIRGVFVEKDGAVATCKAVESLFARWPCFGRRNGLDGGLDNLIPKLLVLGA